MVFGVKSLAVALSLFAGAEAATSKGYNGQFSGYSYSIPGTPGNPSGRFYTCGTAPGRNGLQVIATNSDTSCSNKPPLGDVIVQFDGSAGCKEIKMRLGENWSNGYDSMGRCGGGSRKDSWFSCSTWARDCLKHDVCSFYYSASGGPFDSNCGDEWNQASGDWANWCATNNNCIEGQNANLNN